MKTLNNLPPVQQEFANQFDGTLESVSRFEAINKVLNPTYSAHYFYVSGDTPETTITTKDTDGSFAYWGCQTEEQMSNSYKLARELRSFILSFNPKPLEEIVNYDIEKMREFGKISRVRRRAGFIINGKIVLVKGFNI